MPIDINTASLEELVNLEGMGAPLADAIIAARPFSSMEELVSVLGEAAMSQLRDQGVAVGAVPNAPVAQDRALYYESLEHWKGRAYPITQKPRTPLGRSGHYARK
jgi:hypothetical protein